MADFNLAIPIILKHEGGYVDHPNDPGGATNRGIIFSLFKRYAPSLGLKPDLESLKQLTEYDAKTIYRLEFWDKMLGDSFQNQQVANIVFDAFVNMGPRALKMLQRELNVVADGIVGRQTINAVNKADPKEIFDAFKAARVFFYRDLAHRKPQMQVFLKGWLNRADSFHYT
jgi:lysozyme family protein